MIRSFPYKLIVFSVVSLVCTAHAMEKNPRELLSIGTGPVSQIGFTGTQSNLLVALPQNGEQIEMYNSSTGYPTNDLREVANIKLSKLANIYQGQSIAIGKSTIAALYQDEKMRLWDVETQQVVATYDTNQFNDFYNMHLSPDEQECMVSSYASHMQESELRRFDFRANTVHTWQKKINPYLTISRDGSRAVRQNESLSGLSLAIDNPKTGEFIKECHVPYALTYQPCVFSGNQEITAPTYAPTTKLGLWEIEKDGFSSEVFTQHGWQAIVSAAVLKGRECIALTNEDSNVYVFSLILDKCLKLTGHTERSTAIAFNDSGSHLASASDDEIVIIWDILQE